MQRAIIVEAEELQELVENAVAKALSKTVGNPSMQAARKLQAEDSDYLNTGQACKYLHCSRPFLYKIQKEGLIKVYPVGLHNLYRRTELEAYIQSRQEKSG